MNYRPAQNYHVKPDQQPDCEPVAAGGLQYVITESSGYGHNASLRCAWLKDTRAHFVADTPVQNSCQGAHWITARKGHGTKWTLRLGRRLPHGQYVGYSRATNAAGVTQRQFTAANKRAFRVR